MSEQEYLLRSTQPVYVSEQHIVVALESDEVESRNEHHARNDAERTINRPQQQRHDILSLSNIMEWIKSIKGGNLRISALILATALRIRGPMTANNICVVERITRADPVAEVHVQRDRNTRNLSGVVQDANKIHRFFTTPANMLGCEMIECDMNVQRPNEDKTSMIDAVTRRFTTQGTDIVFLYYTGHGVQQTGDWAIARANEQEGYDVISLDEILDLWDFTRESRNENSCLIIIADSCFSGAWVNEINRRRQSSDRDIAATVANVSMAASCEADEACYENEDGGDFTFYLLRPLESHPVHTSDINPALYMGAHVQVLEWEGLCAEINRGLHHYCQVIRNACHNFCEMIQYVLLCPCRSCVYCFRTIADCIRQNCSEICNFIERCHQRAMQFWEEHKCLVIIVGIFLCIFLFPLFVCFLCCYFCICMIPACGSESNEQ
jgi:hypothetical protein